jgi:hypothetical protein
MRNRLFVLIAGTTASLLGAGCGQMENPVRPLDSGDDHSNTTVQGVALDDGIWNEVASATVSPTSRLVLKGSRYTLSFRRMSVRTPRVVTIRERASGVVDVDLSPEGTMFYKPVTLIINYKGTAYDSSMPNYGGSSPHLYWFNPTNRSWTLIPGTDDPRHSTYTVKLQHFSRYAMGDGTKGWGNREGGGDHGSIN